MKNLKIKKNDTAFLVPSAFVDGYMIGADEVSIKVYLYMLCHINDENLSMDSIGQALGKSVSDVEGAVKRLAEHKIINLVDKKDFCSIEMMPLTPCERTVIPVEIEKDNSDATNTIELSEHPKYLVKEINATLNENKDVRDMFLIAEQLLGKPLNHNEMKILYSFHDWLKLPTSVILMLLEYCTSVKKMDLRYIEKVAITWAEKGIDNFEKASVYIKGQAKLARMEKKVKRIVQISSRELTELETKFVRTWLEEYKASESVIKQAYEITVMNTGKMNFKYMDAVLKNIINDKSAPKKENPKKKTNFNNFTDGDNINDFEKKMIERRMNGTEN